MQRRAMGKTRKSKRSHAGENLQLKYFLLNNKQEILWKRKWTFFVRNDEPTKQYRKNASPQEIIQDARDESEAPLKAIEDFADGAEQRTDALLEKIAPAPENANEKNDDVETQSPETLNDIK